MSSAESIVKNLNNNSSNLPDYRLGFGDVLDIKFFRNSQFNVIITVRSDGRITLPKIGEIQVTGMTPMHRDSIITNTYGKFVLNNSGDIKDWRLLK